jgi:hypothetical protein
VRHPCGGASLRGDGDNPYAGRDAEDCVPYTAQPAHTVARGDVSAQNKKFVDGKFNNPLDESAFFGYNNI